MEIVKLECETEKKSFRKLKNCFVHFCLIKYWRWMGKKVSFFSSKVFLSSHSLFLSFSIPPANWKVNLFCEKKKVRFRLILWIFFNKISVFKHSNLTSKSSYTQNLHLFLSYFLALYVLLFFLFNPMITLNQFPSTPSNDVDFRWIFITLAKVPLLWFPFYFHFITSEIVKLYWTWELTRWMRNKKKKVVCRYEKK